MASADTLAYARVLVISDYIFLCIHHSEGECVKSRVAVVRLRAGPAAGEYGTPDDVYQ